MNIPQKNIKNIEKIWPVAGLALILLLTLMIYWPVAGFGWITGMDQQLLIDNRLVYHFSATNVMDMFFSSVAGQVSATHLSCRIQSISPYFRRCTQDSTHCEPAFAFAERAAVFQADTVAE